MIELLSTRYPYLVVIVLVSTGLYGLLRRNLIKKVIGLNVFQTGIFLFFIVVSYRSGGNPPLASAGRPFVNPLPHVLILTAIVVGVSVTAVSLALIVLLHTNYGTIEEHEIRAAVDADSAADWAAPPASAGRPTGRNQSSTSGDRAADEEIP